MIFLVFLGQCFQNVVLMKGVPFTYVVLFPALAACCPRTTSLFPCAGSLLPKNNVETSHTRDYLPWEEAGRRNPKKIPSGVSCPRVNNHLLPK
jgi:hypothetical protein